jgi:hypothetical protein
MRNQTTKPVAIFTREKKSLATTIVRWPEKCEPTVNSEFISHGLHTNGEHLLN